MSDVSVFGKTSTATFREIVRPQKQRVHGHQRWILRHALGDELYRLRLETGYRRRFDLSMEIKVVMHTIATLERGEPTYKEVTVGTLYRFARAFSREISIKIDGEETHASATTPLEELIAVGARITFVHEG